jgi:hypothetical protein
MHFLVFVLPFTFYVLEVRFVSIHKKHYLIFEIIFTKHLQASVKKLRQ